MPQVYLGVSMRHTITARHLNLIQWLLERQRPSLGRQARLLYGSIDDAVQEIWMVCWKRAPNWPGNWTTSTLITKTAQWVIQSENDRKGALMWSQSQRANWDSPAVEWLVDEDSARDQQRLECALDAPDLQRRLPRRTADILLRHCAFGETYRAIGERYGITKERVRQIIEDAKEHLQEHLA